MLTTFDLDEYVYDALRAGASGFLLKDVPAEQLVDGDPRGGPGRRAAGAVGHPAADQRVLALGAGPRARQGARQPRRPHAARARGLQLIARGLSNAEIAAELVVSETTVKTHVARVLMKLGVRDRVQAVVLAYESGVVAPGEARTSRTPAVSAATDKMREAGLPEIAVETSPATSDGCARGRGMVPRRTSSRSRTCCRSTHCPQATSALARRGPQAERRPRHEHGHDEGQVAARGQGRA